MRRSRQENIEFAAAGPTMAAMEKKTTRKPARSLTTRKLTKRELVAATGGWAAVTAGCCTQGCCREEFPVLDKKSK
jgi:hypothetical protein